MIDKYYLALGRFINKFAEVEGLLFALLTIEAGVYSPIAQAVFSGVRARNAMDFITRIGQAKKQPVEARLKEAFAQLAAINTMRDQLAHWGAEQVGEALEVSNLLRAHTDEGVKRFQVKPEIIDAMTFDLHTIKGLLLIRMIQLRLHRLPDDPQQEEMNRIVSEPWRYKPAQPAPRSGKSSRGS